MSELTIRRNRGIVPVPQQTAKAEKTSAGGQSQKVSARPGFTVSESLRQMMTSSSKAEAGYRESRQTLQTGEAVLAKVQDSLGRMAELAKQAAEGGGSEALQEELERLAEEIDRMTGSAAAGGVQLFLDEGVDIEPGAEALLRAALSETSDGSENVLTLPAWLLGSIAREGLTAGQILRGLGLDGTASGSEILSAIAGSPLESNSAAAYLAALYLGAVISGSDITGDIDPTRALDGLRQLLQQVSQGVEPDAAVEALTGGEITSLADFQSQFTGLSLPGMQEFLLNLLTSQLAASILNGPSLLTLLAGNGGLNLNLAMGLLEALRASATGAQPPQEGAEAAETAVADAAPMAAAAGPENAADPVSVLELGNVQVIGRDLSGVSLDAATGVLTVSGGGDVLIQGTGQGEQPLLLAGSGTVTLREVDAPSVVVESAGARILSAGESRLGEVQLKAGVSLTLGGSGLLRVGAFRGDGTNTLRLTGGAVAAKERGGEVSIPQPLRVLVEGPALLAARPFTVSDGSGRAPEPFDVIWKALLPGFHNITSIAVDGRQAKLALLAGDPPDPLRLWLAKGDLSAHGYPAHGLEIRGRDQSGALRTRYAYLHWSQASGGFEEMAMYPNPFTVTGGEERRDWVYEQESHTLHILSAQVTAISGGAGTDANQAPFSGRIALADHIGALTLTLGGVVCRVAAGRAFDLGRGNDVTLLLQSGTENRFESGEGCAGISLGEGTSLHIDRTEPRGGLAAGILAATGGSGGAGIGRDSGSIRDRTSRIVIRGGVVIAAGTGGGAGIGAGKRGAMGPVSILGGTVSSTGGSGGGAGIGGALGAPVGDIEIRGGTVSAAAVYHAAAIGAGIQGGSGDIHITGSARIERATGGDPGADIGACLFGGCGKVVISGGADIGRAKLRMQSGIPLQIGGVTVTLPQFRLSARALEIRKLSLATRQSAREAQQVIDIDRRWVAQMQTAYNALYSRMEQSYGGTRDVLRRQESGGPVRDAAAAVALLESVARSVPLPDSQAVRSHGKRGKEDIHQLLG